MSVWFQVFTKPEITVNLKFWGKKKSGFHKDFHFCVWDSSSSYSSTKRNSCIFLHGWFSGLAKHVRFFGRVSDISLENSVCQPNFSAFLILKECYHSQPLFLENPALDISYNWGPCCPFFLSWWPYLYHIKCKQVIFSFKALAVLSCSSGLHYWSGDDQICFTFFLLFPSSSF